MLEQCRLLLCFLLYTRLCKIASIKMRQNDGYGTIFRKPLLFTSFQKYRKSFAFHSPLLIIIELSEQKVNGFRRFSVKNKAFFVKKVHFQKSPSTMSKVIIFSYRFSCISTKGQLFAQDRQRFQKCAKIIKNKQKHRYPSDNGASGLI